MRRVAVLFLFFIQIIAVVSQAAESKVFKINSTTLVKKPKSLVLMEAIVSRLYEEAGLKVEFLNTSRSREALLLEQGKLDAVLARYREVGDENSSLKRLEPAMLSANVFVICNYEAMCSLFQQKRVGFLKRFQYAKNYCRLNNMDCIEFNSELSLHKAANEGFIDVMIKIGRASCRERVCMFV